MCWTLATSPGTAVRRPSLLIIRDETEFTQLESSKAEVLTQVAFRFVLVFFGGYLF